MHSITLRSNDPRESCADYSPHNPLGNDYSANRERPLLKRAVN